LLGIRADEAVVCGALIEVTASGRADEHHDALAHAEKTATDGEARWDHDVSKTSIRAS
jgi:hypothetical protein